MSTSFFYVIHTRIHCSASSSEHLTTSDERDAAESSTVPSSAWSRKRREMYESFTPDEQALFDELQQEINFLKQLLARRDKQAAEKVMYVCDKHPIMCVFA